MRAACEFQESSAERKEDLQRVRQGGNILWRVARISVMGKVCPVPASSQLGGQAKASCCDRGRPTLDPDPGSSYLLSLKSTG